MLAKNISWFFKFWSSEVKVKVTERSKLRKYPFSTSISSVIYCCRLGLIMDYESMGKYLKPLGPDYFNFGFVFDLCGVKVRRKCLFVPSSNANFSITEGGRVELMVSMSRATNGLSITLNKSRRSRDT